MIPRLAGVTPAQSKYLAFFDALRDSGFQGEIRIDQAARLVQGIDNSIYQLLPQGVVYPRHTDDLARLTRLANEPRFREIVLAPRGGGTGTNGQSLTDGVVVDVSRHMNRILEINVEQRWARVEAGVVKDQLNAALAPHGLFFAPELSTSNRATIGGMVSTDASGQGSCLYGKTRDHVLGLKTVFLDGTVWDSSPLGGVELERVKQRVDRVGALHRVLDDIVSMYAAEINSRFPKLNRCLTGYDLAHVRDGAGRFDLNAILCGSEGTLGFVAEVKLNLVPIPACSALVNLRYASFEHALRDAQALMTRQPASIEVVDSRVLELAMADIIWSSVSDLFPADGGAPTRGVNLVEFIADDPAQLRAKLSAFTQWLDASLGQSGRCTGYSIAADSAQVQRVWAMRKKAVGLLGKVDGGARPIPFVEDTAVPPQRLADYIMEFRAVLDREGLSYGMFGHVDAGVLHVRPALDLTDPAQEPLIRRVTDAVAALTRKHGGLLWGEHGKGLRSEYAPEFFGPLYRCLQQVKQACDPHNQLNPGKICTPLDSGAMLTPVDAPPTRGQHDRQIPIQVRRDYAAAMGCNGNGACFNFDHDDAMCPSWKGTRDRVHSPKGRATLVREWLRQLALAGIDPAKEALALRRRPAAASWLKRLRNTLARRRGEYDFSHEVKDAMDGCLACKSCATQCPIRVNVPDFRSRFLELYHGRYLRPARHYLLGWLEQALPHLGHWSGAYNHVMEHRAMRALSRRVLGLVDSPRLSGVDLVAQALLQGVQVATPEALAALPPARRARAVVVVQDAFTSHFETTLVLDVLDLLQRLGFEPWLAPFQPNGKALHVHGFLGSFERVAQRNARMLSALRDQGVALVGIDPSMTLTYRAEYGEHGVEVHLLQEWLARQEQQLRRHAPDVASGFELLAHCTERTNAAASLRDWQRVFEILGQTLAIPDVGCCGMAGTYGHEAEHEDMSRQLYGMSWSAVVNDPKRSARLVASGYSCRSQVQRIDGRALPHPAQALLGLYRATARGVPPAPQQAAASWSSRRAPSCEVS